MSSLFDFFFPKFCLFCHREGKLVCHQCQAKFKPSQLKCPLCFKPLLEGVTHPRCRKKYSLDGLFSIYQYGQPEVQRIIKDVKYRFYYGYLDCLLTVALPTPPVDFLVPLPLHWRRRNWRGFNQAEKIARELERKWNLPYYDLLVRTKATKSLAEMESAQERKCEIKGVFGLNPQVILDRQKLVGKRVLLVDDVFTSGASLNEACKVLKRNGVSQVFGWTLAA